MKRSLLAILFFTSISLIAQDSKIELIPFAGYTFSGKQSYPNADTDMKDATNFGMALDLRIARSNLVELMYNVIPTNVNSTIYWGPTVGTERKETPLNAEYYHIGGVQEFSTENVRPFTVVTLGATRFAPTGETTSNLDDAVVNADVWAFSAALGGGAKIMFSERIGLRLQARLLLPMYFNGVGIYCSSGCGGGASFGVYFLQLDLTGGLVIGLGEY